MMLSKRAGIGMNILVPVIGAFLMAAPAHAWTVSAVANPAGPVEVGDTFTVELSLSGWVSTDPEVDAVTFRVDFDDAMFSYVGGSGTGVDDFLKDNQGVGYSFDDSSAIVDADTFGVDYGDGGFTLTGAGPGASGGLLAKFDLMATAVGTGNVDPLGDVDFTFFDVDGFNILELQITGSGSFVGTSVEVVPEPGSAVVMLAAFAGASFVMTSKRSRREVR